MTTRVFGGRHEIRAVGIVVLMSAVALGVVQAQPRTAGAVRAGPRDLRDL